MVATKKALKAAARFLQGFPWEEIMRFRVGDLTPESLSYRYVQKSAIYE